MVPPNRRPTIANHDTLTQRCRGSSPESNRCAIRSLNQMSSASYGQVGYAKRVIPP